MMSWWRAALVAAAIGVLAAVAPAGAVTVSPTGGGGSGIAGQPITPVELGATVSDAPTPNDEVQIVSVVWNWSVVSDSGPSSDSCYLPGTAPFQLSQPDPTSAAAELTGTPTTAGQYSFVLQCTVTYTMSDGTTVPGYGTITVAVNVATA
jgi:hypothetical protein